MVGRLAQLLYPDGVEVSSKKNKADGIAETTALLQRERVTIFEAAIAVDNKFILVDILQKVGNTIKLIEVKSKSYDTDKEEQFKQEGKRTTFINSKGQVDSAWKPYIEDIAFQFYVCSLAFPSFNIVPYLLVPDKAKTTGIDGLAEKFAVARDAYGELKVDFTGGENDVAILRQEQLLVRVNMEEEVCLVQDDVKSKVRLLEQSLTPTLSKIAAKPGRFCKSCEYRTGGPRCGFTECWGESAARNKPHIFDLYYDSDVDQEVFQGLIDQGKTHLFDIPTDCIASEKVRGRRQLIQIRNTRANSEWFSDELADVIRGVEYPLHFIDFETSRVALPYHIGMSPYEQVAFQWSCHTIEAPGEVPVHNEWINTEKIFPNFEFATSLRSQIGDTGTVLTWATHENTVLSDIATQLSKYGNADEVLKTWLETITDKESARILDLNRATLQHYFHPEMAGKTSLKYVLPAIWRSNSSLHSIPWFKKYVANDAVGNKVSDPYLTLPSLNIDGKDEVVRDGTGAMFAYQHLLFGTGRGSPAHTKEALRKLLLQYCELDTLAMVIVWLHWSQNVLK